MNLNRLAYFAAVVDTGSFTQAAARLGITKAVVSHQVAQLEQELRTNLLVRSTRRVYPTEAGQVFYQRCTRILREAEDAFGEMQVASAAPTGTLRLTAPSDYGIKVIVPLIAAFSKRYLACKVDLRMTDTTLDIVSSQIDMAIRVGWLDDSSLQARKIASFRQILVGVPGLPMAQMRAPDEIADLPFVAHTALRDPLVWQFSHANGESRKVALQAAISIDTTLGVLQAVRCGGGISILPEFLIADDIAQGRLCHILPDWQLRSGGVHTVYPAARFRPAKVTAFVEMLVESYRK